VQRGEPRPSPFSLFTNYVEGKFSEVELPLYGVLGSSLRIGHQSYKTRILRDALPRRAHRRAHRAVRMADVMKPSRGAR
jgi:hypothetical protein